MTRKGLINLLWLVVILFAISGCTRTEAGEEGYTVDKVTSTIDYQGEKSYTSNENTLNNYVEVEVNENEDKSAAGGDYEDDEGYTSKENIPYQYFEASIGEGINDAMTMISAGVDRSFAIHADGSLWAWGWNRDGLLGDDTTENRYSPVKVMNDVITVSAEWHRTWAIKSDGSLWGWGDVSALIGEASGTYQLSPVKVMEDVVAISSGFNTSLVIRIDGNLWSIGNDPTKIMEDVAAVSVGGEGYTLAIRGDGSLWAWGMMTLGAPTPVHGYHPNIFHIESPVKIMEDVIAVSVGANHAMAITSDSALWAWGSGGSIGDGTLEIAFAPVKIMEDVIAVSAGLGYTMAIRSDGSLWAWGSNWYGQLGDGTRENRLYPVKIMENVVSVSTKLCSGRAVPGWRPVHTLAVKTDGTLWSWGSNNNGQLGYCTADFHTYEDDGFVGPISTVPHPVKIMGDVHLP